MVSALIRSCTLVALVATPAVALHVAEDSVTFRKRVPPVGTTKTEAARGELELAVEVELDGEVIESGTVTQTQVEESTVRVLAVNDEAATKVEVAYGTMGTTRSEGGPEVLDASPIANKTYVAEATDDGVAVTTAEGEAPPQDELDAVREDNERLGQRERLAGLLPDGPVAIGSELPVTEEMTRLFFDDENLEADELGLRLTGVRDGLAVFAVTMKLTGEPQPGMTMEMDLSGEMTVRLQDGWLAAVSLSGPVAMSGARGEGAGRIEMEGSGTMTIAFDASYTVPE